jgi:hypothetical protein
MGTVGGVSHIISYENLLILERLVSPLQAHIFHESNPPASCSHNIQKEIRKEAGTMGYVGGVGASCAGYGLGTTTGVILVLFILLVIISRTFI